MKINFDLKKFLVENKLTPASQKVDELRKDKKSSLNHWLDSGALDWDAEKQGPSFDDEEYEEDDYFDDEVETNDDFDMGDAIRMGYFANKDMNETKKKGNAFTGY
jgi:hypothetical protein